MSTPQIPDFLPVLSAGSHDSPAEGACAMEYVSFLAGEPFSDRPKCVHPVIAAMARTVNDRLSDGDRHKITHLLPACMGTVDDSSDFMERRVLSVRLAAWCAQQVVHLAANRGAAEKAIGAALAWADCPCDDHAAYAASCASAASYAASYASYAASCASCASAASYAASCAANDLPALLEGLIKEHARLTGRSDIPTLTETDAARMRALTAVSS